MEIIDELELNRRGVYTGAIGYFSRGGISRFNIAIRTLLVEGERVHYHVGGGIVADSDPEAEYLETLHKGRGLRKAPSGTANGRGHVLKSWARSGGRRNWRDEMIWHDGRIILEGDLKVGIEDRVFEHGPLFARTFRTWDGRAPLLSRHPIIAGLCTALGIDLDRVRLLDRAAVTGLLAAVELGGDVRLRLTLTAGSGRPAAGLLAGSEAASLTRTVALVRPGPSFSGEPDDFVHPHKMLNYWGRRTAYELARLSEVDEPCSSRGMAFCEGSRNNVLIVPPGQFIGSRPSVIPPDPAVSCAGSRQASRRLAATS